MTKPPEPVVTGELKVTQADMSAADRRLVAASQDEAVVARFWEKVDQRGDDECWPWTGPHTKNYGSLSDSGRGVRATRLSLVIHTGAPPPSGMFACHACDNPICVNPRHLWWGTGFDNMQDAVKKGRQNNIAKDHCAFGHPYSGDNLYVRNNGQRECVACQRNAHARFKAKLKDQRFQKRYGFSLATQQEIDGLKKAVAEVLSHRVGDLPNLGYIRDNDESRAAIARLAAAANQEQAK